MSTAPCLPSHVELNINGIKTVIVDPHNEIMPYWFMEFLRHKMQPGGGANRRPP